MPSTPIPGLSLAIDRLRAGGRHHFVVHVIQAPYRAGYVMADCIWSESLNQLWQSWQEMFSARELPMVPYVSEVAGAEVAGAEVAGAEGSGLEGSGLVGSEVLGIPEPLADALALPAPPMPQSVRLMQTLGIGLWQWLFNSVLQSTLSQSQGIAMGQNQPLRLRLDIRDPALIALPWEIMQAQAGRPAVSLGSQLLFSRTTSDVDTLPPLRTDQALKILLVLGQDAEPNLDPAGPDLSSPLKLFQEADALTQILTSATRFGNMAPCSVETLVQPTPAELIQALESQEFNVFFYAGHGVPAPDGGSLFLRPQMVINGTELAQVLTRGKVKLAVFNACWGAQPDQHLGQAIPRSSLAEVLLHHGVPAVLAMRDSITDQEALSFIQTFAQALADRLLIDQAVAVARQHLLTLFKFNQQAWTLPVLYMHPEFDGELIKPLEQNLTQMPSNPSQLGRRVPIAALRSPSLARTWALRGSLMRVGMSEDNDVVLSGEPGVSRKHAEIFARSREAELPQYFLRDFSRYGTWVSMPSGWQKVHQQEVALQPGAQLKFGGSENAALEFVVLDAD
jgi:CHAT domain/FHA domain